MAATGQFCDSLFDHAVLGVIADVSCQPRRHPQEHVIQDIGLHDTGEIRKSRKNQEGIQQRGMIGGNYQGTFATQVIKTPDIKTASPHQGQCPQIDL